MNFDMTFIYTSSLNIILLLFIFAAVGYILQDGAHGPFLSKKLYKYIHLMLGIVVISDIWLIVESNFGDYLCQSISINYFLRLF